MIDEEARRKITRARSQLILHRPFWGYLCLHLKPIENNNMPMPTIGTDGKHLFYDSEYIRNVDDDQLQGLIAHEVYHAGFGHIWRRGQREPDRWNIAADGVTNYHLIKQKFILPPGVVSIHEAEKLSVEELYLRIKEQEQTQGKVLDDHSKWGEIIVEQEGEGKGDSGKERGKEAKKEEGGQVGSGDEIKNDKEEEQTGSGGESETKEGEAESTGEASKELKDISKSLFEAEEQAKKLEAEWKEHISRARQIVKMQGHGMGDMEELIDDLLEPKLDWREILRNFVLSVTKSNYRIIPPSKKHLWRGVYLPACYGEDIEIGYAIDTSGSMSTDEVREGVSELRGICQQFDTYSIWVIQCDDGIQEVKELTPYNFDFIEKRKGRGGTSHIPVFNYIDEHDLNITCLVCFTDGYTTTPSIKPSYPVLWVLPEEGAEEGSDYWDSMKQIGDILTLPSTKVQGFFITSGGAL